MSNELKGYKESEKKELMFISMQKGDILKGYLAEQVECMNYSKTGKEPRWLFYNTDTNTSGVLPNHTALNNLLASRRIGDNIAIECLGEKIGKTKRVFIDYKVYDKEVKEEKLVK